MFHIVAMDDQEEQRGYATDVLKATVRWGLSDIYIAHHTVDTIDKCIDLPKNFDRKDEWMFVLDCDMTKKSEHRKNTRFGGYQAWAGLTRTLDKPFFAIIYSDSVTELCDSVKDALDRLVPPIYLRSTAKDGGEDPWWHALKKWLNTRQATLIASVDIEERSAMCNHLNQHIDSDPQKTLEFCEQSTIHCGHDNIWKLAYLFPEEMAIIRQSIKYGDDKWQGELKKIYLQLLPSFPPILHKAAHILFENLKSYGHNDEERRIGSILGDKLDHLEISAELSKIFEENSLVWIWVKSRFSELYQEFASTIHPLENRSAAVYGSLREDLIIKHLARIGRGMDASSVKSAIIQFKHCVYNSLPDWAIPNQNPREDFKNVPLLATVTNQIKKIIDSQASEHGDLPEAQVVLSKSDDIESVTIIGFRTQSGSSPSFNPKKVMDLCTSERKRPQPTKLVSLLEWVCERYQGKVYIVQGPPPDNTEEGSKYMYAKSNYIEAKEGIPFIPHDIQKLIGCFVEDDDKIEEENEKIIESMEGKDPKYWPLKDKEKIQNPEYWSLKDPDFWSSIGRPSKLQYKGDLNDWRLVGTYYFLIFPHFKLLSE